MDGELIYEIGDSKLVYTDGDYDYPRISKVIEIGYDNPDVINDFKGEILDVENSGNEIEETIEIYKTLYGEEAIKTTTFRDRKTNKTVASKLSNERGNRSESSGTDSDSRKDVGFSIDG